MSMRISVVTRPIISDMSEVGPEGAGSKVCGPPVILVGDPCLRG